MKVSRNNKLINLTLRSYCLQCAFFCKNSPACLLSMIPAYLSCGGTYANEKLPEIFTL